MMYDTWQSYFYPETYNPATGQGTLRNLFGERDAVASSLLEYAYTLSRARNLTYEIVDVERTFDAEHLRTIHRYLFQDVFEWAGHYRSVNMSKNMSSFADVHSGEVDQYLDDVHRLVNQTSWAERPARIRWPPTATPAHARGLGRSAAPIRLTGACRQ